MMAFTHSATSLRREATYTVGAWGVLMLFTATLWWLGSDHDVAGLGSNFAMISILVLTFGKIYLVGHAFMEMRHAAAWLHRTFASWCCSLCAALTVLYLMV